MMSADTVSGVLRKGMFVIANVDIGVSVLVVTDSTFLFCILLLICFIFFSGTTHQP